MWVYSAGVEASACASSSCKGEITGSRSQQIAPDINELSKSSRKINPSTNKSMNARLRYSNLNQ